MLRGEAPLRRRRRLPVMLFIDLSAAVPPGRRLGLGLILTSSSKWSSLVTHCIPGRRVTAHATVASRRTEGTDTRQRALDFSTMGFTVDRSTASTILSRPAEIVLMRKSTFSDSVRFYR